MNTEYLFYTIGIIFLIAAILYFAWDYLFQLARSFKILILSLLCISFYTFANYLKERDI